MLTRGRYRMECSRTEPAAGDGPRAGSRGLGLAPPVELLAREGVEQGGRREQAHATTTLGPWSPELALSCRCWRTQAFETIERICPLKKERQDPLAMEFFFGQSTSFDLPSRHLIRVVAPAAVGRRSCSATRDESWKVSPPSFSLVACRVISVGK